MRRILMLAACVGLATPAYAQLAPQQSEFRSFGYARLGYGGIFAGRVHAAPAIGFGFRGESGSLGLDVSSLNYIISDEISEGFTFAGSLIKIQALHLLNPEGNRSGYVGLGVSWGGVAAPRSDILYASEWHGSGLQGELTAGCELMRNSPLRTFIQADFGLPFYKARSDVYNYLRPGLPSSSTVDQRYIPSIAVSLGVGWQRQRR